MYHPKTDVTHQYRYVRTDFIKHLFSTTVVVLVATTLLSLVFHEPVRPAVTIQQVATTNPVMFEQVAVRAMNGQGQIANYGPPYNHGTGSLQDVVQKWVGVIHPVNTERDFVLTPLTMAAHLRPGLTAALTRFRAASSAQQLVWENRYLAALHHARVQPGTVTVPAGSYGPMPVLMTALLHLGQSGMMAGALDRTTADYTFSSQNSLLFLQGEPLQTMAGRLQLLGTQFGIIHEEKVPYPGPWWMTIVTVIYQIPYIANSPAADALALGAGMILFLLLVFAPWLPVINRLPRYLGIHRLIWKQYYQDHPGPSHPSVPDEGA